MIAKTHGRTCLFLVVVLALSKDSVSLIKALIFYVHALVEHASCVRWPNCFGLIRKTVAVQKCFIERKEFRVLMFSNTASGLLSEVFKVTNWGVLKLIAVRDVQKFPLAFLTLRLANLFPF